jgi:hypothetical protein
VRLTTESVEAQNMAIIQSPFIYNCFNSKAQAINIATGSNSAQLNNVFSGSIPNVVAVMLLNTDTYTQTDVRSGFCLPFSCGSQRFTYGGLSYNPTVSQLWLMAGDQKYPKQNEYLCNYSAVNQQYVVSSYNEYKKCCLDQDKPFLTFQHWQNQFTVYYINLCNDPPLMSASDTGRIGTVSINFVFNYPLDSPLTVIAVGLFFSELKIDKNRSVSMTNWN